MNIKDTKNQIIIVLVITILILTGCIVYNRFFNKKSKIIASPVTEDTEHIEVEPEQESAIVDAVKIPKKIQIFEKYRNREYSLRESAKRFKNSRRNFLTEYYEYLKNYDINQR